MSCPSPGPAAPQVWSWVWDFGGEITPCPVQMKNGGTTDPGLMGPKAQPVLFAYLQFFNNIIY